MSTDTDLDFQETGDLLPTHEDASHTVSYINEAGIPEVVAEQVIQHQDVARTIENWMRSVGKAVSTNSRSRRGWDVFSRDDYQQPNHVFEIMAQCSMAVEEDDILSTLVDTIEGLSFSKMGFEAADPDQADVWNQWAGHVDLDSRVREVFRELFKVSQVYIGLWWEPRIYTVRTKPDPEGESKGKGNRKRKKQFPVVVPTSITVFDPTKVVPVGMLMFNQERFAYIADEEEDEAFSSVMAGEIGDSVVQRMLAGRYTPASKRERDELADLGVDVKRLWLFRKEACFRHTLTRAQYERFAKVRLKSILPILEMKHHLRSSDRASLIGASLRTDQRVRTPEGWRAIGTVTVGDEVYGPDGRPTEVIGVFPQGVRPLHRMTFSDGSSVICDDEHLWTVYRPDDSSKGRSPRTIKTRQIIEEGLWAGERHRHRIQVTDPVELPEASLPLDPYLLGTLLGDGGFTNTTPKLTSGKPEQPWREVLPEGIRVVQYGPDSNPTWGLSYRKRHTNPITRALTDLGLWGHRSEDKFIPDAYLAGSVQQRWALLQGLVDTDGSIANSGMIEYPTTSRKLAEGVVELVQSLGGLATLKEREAKGKLPLYRIFISLAPDLGAPTRLDYKRARWSPRKTRLWRHIVKVEPVDPGEAVCIKVAREDGLFLTEDHIVTHNTNFIVVITKGTDKFPARQAEVEHLQEQSKVVARMPILVGDHRLNVEIVTPLLDNTLIESRYQTLDSRLVFKALMSFHPQTQGGTGGSQIKDISRIVARGLESRRHQMIRSLEANIFRKAVEANQGILDETPHLSFMPRRISLEFNADIVKAVMEIRDRGDMSRETMLEELDYDQDTEMMRRIRERDDGADDVFLTHVPFDSPEHVTPSQSGKQGGRPKGVTETKERAPKG